MAILNLEYYTQKDLYSDGDIEKQMLCMAKNGISFEDLPEEQVNFPIIYHFSEAHIYFLHKRYLQLYLFHRIHAGLHFQSIDNHLQVLCPTK